MSSVVAALEQEAHQAAMLITAMSCKSHHHNSQAVPGHVESSIQAALLLFSHGRRPAVGSSAMCQRALGLA